MLRYLNTDDAIRANAGFYTIIDGLGRDANSAGAAYTAAWYGRNSYIFSNILNVTSPGDRAAVLIGQAMNTYCASLCGSIPILRTSIR